MAIKTFLPVLYLFIAFSLSAQPAPADCLQQQLKTGSAEDIGKITTLLTESLPAKRFYFIGESHTFLANNHFQFELIKALQPKGVFNVANELPHATCFLFNQYLETGDEAILTSLRPAADYTLLKQVRQYNASLPAGEQIRYYGIDYISPRNDFHNYFLTLKRIRSLVPSQSLPLDTIIDHYLQKDSLQLTDVKKLNMHLQKGLTADKKLYQSHFGAYYDDLLLISYNDIGYDTNRDSSIFENFLLLASILSARQSAPPKFLAFYGIGHLGDLGGLLEEDERSPARNSVNRIGIQYINCQGGWDIARNVTTGLFKYDKKELAAFISYCEGKPWKVAWLPGGACLQPKKGNRLDGIVIFNEYGDRKMNSWKFD